MFRTLCSRNKAVPVPFSEPLSETELITKEDNPIKITQHVPPETQDFFLKKTKENFVIAKAEEIITEAPLRESGGSPKKTEEEPPSKINFYSEIAGEDTVETGTDDIYADLPDLIPVNDENYGTDDELVNIENSDDDDDENSYYRYR
jgi:hypothetical protein